MKTKYSVVLYTHYEFEVEDTGNRDHDEDAVYYLAVDALKRDLPENAAPIESEIVRLEELKGTK